MGVLLLLLLTSYPPQHTTLHENLLWSPQLPPLVQVRVSPQPDSTGLETPPDCHRSGSRS